MDGHEMSVVGGASNEDDAGREGLARLRLTIDKDAVANPPSTVDQVWNKHQTLHRSVARFDHGVL
jgi:hypothetical protein